jgi:hypothetical protein
LISIQITNGNQDVRTLELHLKFYFILEFFFLCNLCMLTASYIRLRSCHNVSWHFFIFLKLYIILSPLYEFVFVRVWIFNVMILILNISSICLHGSLSSEIHLRNDCLNFQVHRRLNRCCLFANYIIRVADYTMFANRQHRFYLRWTWKLKQSFLIIKFSWHF